MSWHPDAARDAGAGAEQAQPDAGGDTPPVTEPDDRVPSATRRALTIAIGAVGVILVLAALVGGSARPPGSATFPPVGATTGPAGDAAAATRGEVVRALGAAGLQAEDAPSAYRPPEAAELASAPRLVVRAILPDDPAHGRIVVYELSSPAAAEQAARAQADYIASGVGRVQFPPDSRYVLRVVGSTVVFFTWSPASSPDPRTGDITPALEGLGLGIAIPG